MLDLRRLRILHSLAQHGTISATAAALHPTGPAVSQRLAVLEREAGTPLLEKQGRTLAFTPAGRLLVSRVAVILDDLAAAKSALAAAALNRVTSSDAGIASGINVAAFQVGGASTPAARLDAVAAPVRPGARGCIHGAAEAGVRHRGGARVLVLDGLESAAREPGAGLNCRPGPAGRVRPEGLDSGHAP